MSPDEFEEHLRTRQAEYEKHARQREREWRWMNRLLLLAFILGVLGIVSRVFWP
jgi:hypothetical protein